MPEFFRRTKMKKTGILLGFVPLIVFGVLAGSSVESVVIALVAALIVAVITGFSDLRKGRILSWATIILFSSLLLAVGVLGLTWIIPVMGMLIYAALAAVTFGSILAKIPFTLEYAREMVDRKLWENPVFIRVNVLMTGVWGAIFVINFILSYLPFAFPYDVGWITSPLTYLVLIAGIIFTIWYPGYMQKKHSSASGQHGTGEIGS
jgi:energy-converting hydrogenase Eha subunit A